MRLLHTNIESLRLQFFMPGRVPEYVILSHLWGEEEIIFEDFTKQGTIDPGPRVLEKKGFAKIKGACELAARDGYEWIWIDTCCIDKSSSSELQESINSMWQYYARSNICYAYMSDIPDAKAGWGDAFRRSRWHTRGWTLQELIAPASVEFYASDWAPIGTKSERYLEIAKKTKINPNVLNRTDTVYIYSAAEKFSWAAHREVTREEDETYCLLGIFDVNMPMLYGEGRRKAFFRLQEAIYSATLDHSLFLFRYSDYDDYQPLLAESPAEFCPKWEKPCRRCAKGTQAKFPADTSYDELMTATSWNVQAHDQVWTTAAPNGSEASTTLSLLNYKDVSKKLIWFQDPPDLLVTHVAVLNYTFTSYKHGALCLLLYCSRDNVEEGSGMSNLFNRIDAYPVILPSWEKFSSKIHSRRVLLCAGSEVLSSGLLFRGGHRFTFASESFAVQSWHANNVWTTDECAVEGQSSSDFVVHADRIYDPSNKAPEISCLIAGSAGFVAIRLAWSDGSWWIKKAREVKCTSADRSRRRSFSTQGSYDRCAIRMSDGAEFCIALRRMPVAKSWSPLAQYYRLIVGPLEGYKME